VNTVPRAHRAALILAIMATVVSVGSMVRTHTLHTATGIVIETVIIFVAVYVTVYFITKRQG
jgi:hypothetical protein